MKIALLLVLLPMYTNAQTATSGVKFEEGLSWKQLLEKAKKEQKFIFVDCFATWCQPCKVMDKTVYTNNKVAEYVNSRFVSIKVQLDSTRNDDDNVRMFYPIARKLEREYSISMLPTYLFFSPQGVIVHKDFGVKNDSDFVKLAIEALDPNFQIYNLIRLWKIKKISYKEMALLALRLKKDYNDDELALSIAKDYQKEYLNKLSNDSFLTKEHLRFIGTFMKMVAFNDKAFLFYYHYPKLVDSITGIKNYAKSHVNYVIAKEMIDPVFITAKEKKTEPNWDSLVSAIKIRFGYRLANEILTAGKVRWYSATKEDSRYVVNLVNDIYLRGLATFDNDLAVIGLNAKAWDVFLYSEDSEYLTQALGWIEHALRYLPTSVAFMDTKANLLYKLKRCEEAIALEEIAVKENKELNETLEKMKKGLPTWNVQNSRN